MKLDVTHIRPLAGQGRKLYIETYGCQMNVGDSEIVMSILRDEGFVHTEDIAEADVILVNTCSIRDNAEQRVWGRLREFKRYKRRKPGLLVGVIGCMAERLGERLMERERIVDIVAGPDSYRDLPRLLRTASDGGRGTNVLLSQEETYAEISPVRLDASGVSAFVAIMRGCNNFCAYCVVPYTRGRERSRDPETILREVRELFAGGYREVTLLGQNVNSYRWGTAVPEEKSSPEATAADSDRIRDLSAAGGEQMAEMTTGIGSDPETVDFPELIRRVARINPRLRVRFATSHPKDLGDRLLETMAAHPNVCRAIHLPAQSGSTRILGLMNRKYTREWYLDRIAAIRRYLPDATVSTDLIAGFCTETDEDHAATLSLMREADYAFAYMFKYSERPDTQAARTMPDDVPDEVKTARLTEIIALQNELSLAGNRRDVGKRFEVLVEGTSKRNAEQFHGRTSQNKVVIFDRENAKTGDYVTVDITGCTSATLLGRIVN